MTWVDLSGAFSYGTKLTSTQMQNLRDNITAAFNKDSGAPTLANDYIVNAMMANDSVGEDEYIAGSVDRTALKTNSAGVQSGSLAVDTEINVSMQDYCFAASTWKDSGEIGVLRLMPYSFSSDPSNTTARLRIRNEAGATTDYSVRWRYVTATDKPCIVAHQNDRGEIQHIWACADPPTDYWGIDDEPDDFESPFVIMNNAQIITPFNQVVIFNYPDMPYYDLMARSYVDRVPLHKMLTNDFDLRHNTEQNRKLFKRKNLSMI